METTLRSSAKINLGLKVLQKREDGFHDIETIFYPVSLHDDIIIDIKPGLSGHNTLLIHCNKQYVPQNKDNICYKAIEAFFRKFHITESYDIDIRINKRIPVGGGLGGGSSNAAAVIEFIVKHFNIDIQANRNEIIETALSIGSDVPFFLFLKPAFAAKRGEEIHVLDNFKIDNKILIVNPNLHISTKWAFEALGMVSGELSSSELNSVKTFIPENYPKLENDFEAVVFDKYPVLGEIKNELYKMGAEFASMSGTGATMYGIFPGNDEIQKAYRKYKDAGYFVFISE
ncbi:4-(cytidine 5'-diphospho)-2-C-methyl-D-erythritol kinase [soil metagenome]